MRNKNKIAVVKEQEVEIVCGLDDIPPWYLSVFMALQVYYCNSFGKKIRKNINEKFF